MAKSPSFSSDADKENSTPNTVNHVVEAPSVVAPTKHLATKKIFTKKRRTLSQKADLIMPVLQIHRNFRKKQPKTKVYMTATIYATAVLEYLVGEVLDVSAECCLANKRKKIQPRHITLSVRQDDELKKLFSNTIIFEGGVVPFIHSALLPLRSSKNVLDKTVDRSEVDPADVEVQE